MYKEIMKWVLNLIYFTIVFIGFLNVCASLYYWEIIGVVKFFTIYFPTFKPESRVLLFVFFLLYVYWVDSKYLKNN